MRSATIFEKDDLRRLVSGETVIVDANGHRFSLMVDPALRNTENTGRPYTGRPFGNGRKPLARSAGLKCADCGPDSKRFKTTSALGAHRYRAHRAAKKAARKAS